MVIVCCSNCDSKDVKLDETRKYLICNKCSAKEYIWDLDIGLIDVNPGEDILKV